MLPQRQKSSLAVPFLLIGFLLCGTICARAQTTAPPPAATSVPAGQKWAVLIGIDQYDDRTHINDLSTAVADARALKKTLIEAAGFPEDHIKLLVSDAIGDDPEHEVRPERSNIIRELASLNSHVHSGDLVFVFYSGHGIHIGDTSYLLPWDTKTLDNAPLTETCLGETELRDRLKKLPAQALVLALDMCRNNPLKTGRGVAEDQRESVLHASQVRGLDFLDGTASSGPKLVTTLYSCSEGEHSYEWLDQKRGYFSYFLEQGIRGKAADAKGVVRLNGLLQYLQQSVPQAVKTRESKDQHPNIANIANIVGPGTSSLLNAVALAGVGAFPAPDAAPRPPILSKNLRAQIKLALDPPNAKVVKVVIDGQEQSADGSDTVTINLGSDEQRSVEIGIAADGYQPWVHTITINRGKNIPVTIILVPESRAVDTVARLKVGTNVPRALIQVEGRAIGADGLYTLDLGLDKSRAVEVSISAAGYQPKIQQVVLHRGEVLPLAVALEAAAPVATNVVIPAPVVPPPAKITPLLPPPPSNPPTERNPKDGAEMIWIEKGPFEMGSDQSSQAENPPRVVTLSGYWIYKNMVTVAMFRRFCLATKRVMPRLRDWDQQDNYPVNVSYRDAQAYCAWAGMRLPTEAQWEKAARGTDGRTWPWGNTFDFSCLQASHEVGGGDALHPAPVGSFPSGASPYGVLDMAGNLAQWTTDWYSDKYAMRAAPTVDPTGPPSGGADPRRIIRGGSWNEDTPASFRTYLRGVVHEGAWALGFRCISSKP